MCRVVLAPLLFLMSKIQSEDYCSALGLQHRRSATRRALWLVKIVPVAMPANRVEALSCSKAALTETTTTLVQVNPF